MKLMKLIAEALLGRGIPTKSLMDLTRRTVHPLTPIAEVPGPETTSAAESPVSVGGSQPRNAKGRCLRRRNRLP